jgi:hypothetical protein
MPIASISGQTTREAIFPLAISPYPAWTVQKKSLSPEILALSSGGWGESAGLSDLREAHP